VVLAVIGIQVAMHVGEFVSTTWQGWVQIYYYFSTDLLTIAGIALALSLYKSIVHEQLQLNLDPQNISVKEITPLTKSTSDELKMKFSSSSKLIIRLY